jgi:hypothetical protein
MTPDLIPLSTKEQNDLLDLFAHPGFAVLRTVLESHRDATMLKASAEQLSALKDRREQDITPSPKSKSAANIFAEAARIDLAIQRLVWVQKDREQHKKLVVTV